MPDPIAQCKSYILTNTAADIAGVIETISNHLDVAPAFWARDAFQLDESFVAALKAPYVIDGITYDPHVGVRRAADGLRVCCSPQKGITSPGSFTTAMVDGSTDWSGELLSFEPTSLSDKVIVIELPHCLILLLVNATKDAVSWACMLGGGGIPRQEWRQFGADGHLAISGRPSVSSFSEHWLWDTSSSRIKTGRRTARWSRPSPRGTSQNDALWDPDETGFLQGCVSGQDVNALDGLSGNTSDDIAYGRLAFYGHYPDRLIGTLPSFSRIDAGTQSYLVINYTNANTNLVVPWEPGKSVDLN